MKESPTTSTTTTGDQTWAPTGLFLQISLHPRSQEEETNWGKKDFSTLCFPAGCCEFTKHGTFGQHLRWWHSRKVLFWLHNWICQIGSLTPHPWPVCPKHGHHDDEDVDDEDELQGLKDCPKAILRFEECALARGGKTWNSWYYNCANFTEPVLIFCFSCGFLAGSVVWCLYGRRLRNVGKEI